jgi:predicted O-methyltransferase YrrM
MRGRTYDRPWLAPQAVEFLDRIIERDWVIVELGAGASTAWFGRRAGRVISLESDPTWVKQVESSLEALGVRNVEMHLLSLGEFDDALARIAEATRPDLIVVDQDDREGGERVESVRRGSQLVRPGGYVVLDDSDRPRNRRAFDTLAGWSHIRFVGVRPYPFQATETTVFQRPGPLR